MENSTNSNIPYIAKIMENIRKVIEEDRAQKQPLILRINENKAHINKTIRRVNARDI